MPHRELVAHPVKSAGRNTSHALLDLSTLYSNKPQKMLEIISLFEAHQGRLRSLP